MSKQYTLVVTIASACFAAIWAVNEHLLSGLQLAGYGQIAWGIRMLASVGLFALMFQIMLRVALALLASPYSDEGKLSGDWHQIFVVTSQQNAPSGQVRYGPVSISWSGQTLEISAASRKLGSETSESTWHSNKVSIQGQQIWAIFESSGPGRGTTHGYVLLQFQGTRPKRMAGIFADASPARNFGQIELFRTKADLDDRIREYQDRGALIN